MENRPELPKLSPTGEIHLDPIECEPWKLEEWAKALGIPPQQVKELAAEVGPIFEDIKDRWEEQVAEHKAADAIKKSERDESPDLAVPRSTDRLDT